MMERWIDILVHTTMTLFLITLISFVVEVMILNSHSGFFFIPFVGAMTLAFVMFVLVIVKVWTD